MKKILFVIHSLIYGGAERSLVNLLNELPEDKYQVDLLLFQNKGDFRKQLPEWVNLLETPDKLKALYAPIKLGERVSMKKIAGTVLARIFRKATKRRRFFRWQKVYRQAIEPLEQKYDVAVAYVGSEVMYFVNDKVSADRKLVWIHNDYRTAGYCKEDEHAYLAEMDAIVSVSDECAEILKEEFPEFRERIHYVQNITSSIVVRARAAEFVPEEYDGRVCNILSIGRLVYQKGFDTAIQAAALLKKQGAAFRWFVIGDGELRGELERQIREAGLEEEFILLGVRNNPYPYIRNCRLFVQTSRYEGKSVALDEAKILGRPMVATAYPTVHDQIADGQEGIITPMSAEGVAEGIIALMKDEALYGKIQAYLQAHEYGNQDEIEKYMMLFEGARDAESTNRD